MKTVLLFFLCINVSLAQVNFSYSNKNGELALVMGEGVSGRVKDAVNGLKAALEKTLDTKCQWAAAKTGSYSFVFEFGKIVAPDKECFSIRLSDDKTLLFSGMEEQSLINAVTYFMETELDYNWLYPDSSFITYGKRDKLSFTDYQVIDCPAFKQREISPLDASRNSVFGNWALANGLNSRIEFHHAFNELMNTPAFIEENPEFFPVVKGARYLPKNKTDYNWQPDFVEKGFGDTIASMLLKKRKKDSKINSFSLSMNDSGNFDESREKEKKELNYLKKADYSDEFYTWANQVAEKVNAVHPDVKFGVLAYSNLSEPPSFAVNKNIIPFITFDRMRWLNSELKKTDQDLSAEWAAKVPEIAWYDYVYGSYYIIPRMYPETMQEYLKWGRANKVEYYYAESYPNIGEGPKVWTLSKLLNNPDCNVDSLNQVWCKAAFGKKAAKFMVKYFDNWENFWKKELTNEEWLVNTSQYLPFNNLAYLRELDQAFLNGNKKLAARALKKAKTDFQKKNAAVYVELSNSYLGFLDWIRQQPEGPVYLKSIKDDAVFLKELENFLKISDNEKNYKILTNLLNK